MPRTDGGRRCTQAPVPTPPVLALAPDGTRLFAADNEADGRWLFSAAYRGALALRVG